MMKYIFFLMMICMIVMSENISAAQLKDYCPIGATCRSVDLCGQIAREFNVKSKITTHLARGCRADFLRFEKRNTGSYLLRQCKLAGSCNPVYASVGYNIPKDAYYPQSAIRQDILDMCKKSYAQTRAYPPGLQRECPLLVAWAEKGQGFPIFLASDLSRKTQPASSSLGSSEEYDYFQINYRIEKKAEYLARQLQTYLYEESETNINLSGLDVTKWSHRSKRKAFNYCSFKKAIEWIRSGQEGFSDLYLLEIPILDFSALTGRSPRLEICAEAVFEATPTRKTITDFMLNTPNGTLQVVKEGFMFAGNSVEVKTKGK